MNSSYYVACMSWITETQQLSLLQMSVHVIRILCELSVVHRSFNEMWYCHSDTSFYGRL